MELTICDRWFALTNHINTEQIRNGVISVLNEHMDSLKWMPTSASGKHHQHEPLMIDHVEHCIDFARLVVREFNITGIKKDIFYAGIILHDIGKCMVIFKENLENLTPYGKFFADFRYDHALWGGMIVRAANFMECEAIAELIETHMSHWVRGNPQPNTILQYMVAMCDYFATHIVSYTLSGDGKDGA